MNTRETSIMTRNMSNMNNIMTKLFTVIMLMMFSMRICYYGEFATNRIRS